MKDDELIVCFATKNEGKYHEAACVAAEFGITITQLSLEKHEIQSDDLRIIASVAAQHAFQASSVERVVAEDAGFFVEALNGFPGPYSAYAYRKIGVDGILKLLQVNDRRNAFFASAVAYYDKWKCSACFEGTVQGRVSLLPKGLLGFGFDPIFIPCEGGGRTFAEMETSEKNKFSHRAQAFSKFFKWIKTNHPHND